MSGDVAHAFDTAPAHCRLFPARRSHLVEDLQETRRLDRLGQASIHPGLHAACFHLRRSVGGQRDDRRARLTDGRESIELRRLDPVHHRHIDVHEHEIERLLGERIESTFAVVDDLGLVPAPLENLRNHHLIGSVVLRDRAPRACARLAGLACGRSVRPPGPATSFAILSTAVTAARSTGRSRTATNSTALRAVERTPVRFVGDQNQRAGASMIARPPTLRRRIPASPSIRAASTIVVDRSNSAAIEAALRHIIRRSDLHSAALEQPAEILVGRKQDDRHSRWAPGGRRNLRRLAFDLEPERAAHAGVLSTPIRRRGTPPVA